MLFCGHSCLPHFPAKSHSSLSFRLSNPRSYQMKKITILSLALAVGLIAIGTLLPLKTSGQKSKFRTSARPVANQYIVVLNEDFVGRAAVGIEVETEAQRLS